MKGLGLLTFKPMIYCANVAEGDLADKVLAGGGGGRM